MKARIMKIEPQGAGGNRVTVEVKGTTIELYDPEDRTDGTLIRKMVEVKVCGLEGTAKAAKGPARFEPKSIVAKVIDKGYDYATLDCGAFTFDYMMNIGDEERFVVGEFVRIDKPRLDMAFKDRCK